MHEDQKKHFVTNVALNVFTMLAREGEDFTKPRATARKAFDLAEAFVEEHQARGLVVKP